MSLKIDRIMMVLVVFAPLAMALTCFECGNHLDCAEFNPNRTKDCSSSQYDGWKYHRCFETTFRGKVMARNCYADLKDDHSVEEKDDYECEAIGEKVKKLICYCNFDRCNVDLPNTKLPNPGAQGNSKGTGSTLELFSERITSIWAVATLIISCEILRHS